MPMRRGAHFGIDRQTDPSFGRSGAVALLALMQWGLPLNFIGIPTWVLTQGTSAALFLLAGWRVLVTSKYGRLDRWEKGILAFLCYCYVVTVVSNVAIFGYPMSEWIVSVSYLFPLLFVLAAPVLKIRAADILTGFIVATAFAALLVLVDRISPLEALNSMVSYSSVSNSDRRIVLMHNESAFAFAALLAGIINSNKVTSFILRSMAMGLIGFSLIIVSESRLAVGASLVGIGIYFLFVFRSPWKLLIAAVGLVMVVAVTPVVFGKYFETLSKIGMFGQIDQLTASEDSTNYRMTEVRHFEKYFDDTYGIGFGLMTVSPSKSNIISLSMFKLSALYGVDYQIGLIDIRIYAALYQFGYIGLVLVLFLTYVVAHRTITIGLRRRHPWGPMISAVGCVAIGFLISPLPANLFTVDNTVMIGGLIYGLAAIGTREERVLARVARVGPDGRVFPAVQ